MMLHPHFITAIFCVLHSMENSNLASIFNEVHTSRLILRRLRIEDGPAMFIVHGDPATNRYNPSGPDPDVATSEKYYRSGCKVGKEKGMDIGRSPSRSQRML